jgi:death-on-curing family protein
VERLRRTQPGVPHLRDCDDARIRSALAQPGAGLANGTLLYPTLARQAAVLLYHVTKAHACFDGNKRIAIVLMLTFLELNGLRPIFGGLELVGLTLYAADSDPSDRTTVLDTLVGWIDARIDRTSPGQGTGAIQ